MAIGAIRQAMPYHRGMILPLALLLLASPVQPSPAATELWLGRSAELARACVSRSARADRGGHEAFGALSSR
jgi:hypothetical protein